MARSRKSAVLLFAAAIAGCNPASVCLAQSPAAQAPFSLRISTDHESVKLGSDVDLKITMTNLSVHGVYCSSYYSSGYDFYYHIKVSDETGQPVKKLHLHPERFPGSLQMCTLKPGESTTSESRISWLHDLSRPGKYEILADRSVSNNLGDGSVSSNKITITVTP